MMSEETINDYDEHAPLIAELRGDNDVCTRIGVRHQVLATFSACMGPFSLGFVLAYSSPALPLLRKENILTTDEGTWFGSLVTLGAIVGGPVAGWVVGAIGRKGAIITSAIPYMAGWLIIIVGQSVWMLYLGRVLTGFAAGMSSLLVPLYIAEVADQNIRGMLGASFQIGSTSGILAVYSLGLAMGWRWLAVMSSIPPTIMATLMLFMPETPCWLLARGARPRAIAALQWLRGAPSKTTVIDECLEIEANLLQKTRKISLWEFAQPSLYRPLLLSIGLMFFQQFSGINAIIFYTNTIFKSSGFQTSAGIPTVIVGAVQVAGTVISVFLVDRTGRRPLLIISGALMSLSCISLGIYYYITHYVRPIPNISWLSLASLIIYITAYSIGWGALPWLIMSEIFPGRARGYASGIATASNWLMAFLVTKEFEDMKNAMNEYGVFWMFAGISLTGVVFVISLLPETKGRSLEDIERHFQRHNI